MEIELTAFAFSINSDVEPVRQGRCGAPHHNGLGAVQRKKTQVQNSLDSTFHPESSHCMSIANTALYITPYRILDFFFSKLKRNLLIEF